MALDFQKNPYVKKRGDTNKRTSYMRMNTWVYQQPDTLPNPYASAEEQGIFRNLQPQLDVPLTPSPKQSYRQPGRYSPARLPGTPRLGSMTPSPRPDVYRNQETAYEQRAIREGRIVIPKSPEPGPVSSQYYKSGGYDDHHKTFLQMQKLDMSPTYPQYGPPRLRNGRVGGSWRHIKEVLQAKGQRNLFVDGVPRGYDNSRVQNGEIPAVNLIQPRWGTDNTVKIQPKQVAPWTRHDLEAFKATEGANYHLMR